MYLQPPHTSASSRPLKIAAVLTLGSAILASYAPAAVLWQEDFAGINGPLQDTDRWTGVEGLPDNGSLRNNLLRASDDPFNFGSPAAHKFEDGFFSGGGSVYASLPVTDRYQLTGSLIDFGTGTGRNSNTSVFIESNVATGDHTLASAGWEIRLVRFDGGTENSLQVYDASGERVINEYVGPAPSEPRVLPYEFAREGDTVTVSVFLGEEPVVFSGPDPFPAAHALRLSHRISGFDSDATMLGWGEITVIPEPRTTALALGLAAFLFLSLRRCFPRKYEAGE